MSRPPLLSTEFGILAVAAALYNAGFGAMNVLLPRYVVDELGGSETTAGLVMGSMAITALVSRPWFGRIADRHGARRIIVVGALFGAAGLLLMLPGETYVLSVASRLTTGIASAGVFTGSTLLAMTMAPEQRRAEAAAYILVSVHLGMGLGPIAGEAIRNSMSYDAAWLLVAALMGLAALTAVWLPRRPGDRGAPSPPLVARAAIGPGVVTLFGVFVFNGLLTFVPLYSREIGIDDAALVFTAASGTIVLMRVLFGTAPDRFGPVRCGAVALGITVVAAAVLAFWDEPAGLYVGASLAAAGLSLQSPSFMSIAVRRVPEGQRGAAMGTFTAAFDLATALVGPTVGFIVSGAGYREAFLFTGGLAFVALVVLMFNVAPRERGQVPVLSTSLIRLR